MTPFAQAGADVVIASRKLDACEAAAAQIRASTGSLITETVARLGRLDVLAAAYAPKVRVNAILPGP